MKLWLEAEDRMTELALTAEQQQTGMMFRTNLAGILWNRRINWCACTKSKPAGTP